MFQLNRFMAILLNPIFIGIYFTLVLISYFYLDQPISTYFSKSPALYSLNKIEQAKVSGDGLVMSSNQTHQIKPEEKPLLFILKIITEIGSNKFSILGLLILALIFRYVSQNKLWEMRTWFLWLCVIIPNGICTILKISLGRARPTLYFNEGLYGFYGFNLDRAFWSFPSGHATTIMGLTFGLSILFPRYIYVFLLTGLAVASTRLFLTHHFLSDLLVATYLAFIEVIVLTYFIKRNKKWKAYMPNSDYFMVGKLTS